MATVAVIERGEGRVAHRERNKTTYTRVWRVQFDSVDDGPESALVAVDPSTGEAIPDINDAHPINPFAKVGAIDPRSVDDGRLHWDVIVIYETRQMVQGAGSEPLENPLDEDPLVTWDSTGRDEVIEYTTDSTPVSIVNSAGDRFDPPLTQEVNNLTLTIVRNEETYNPVTVDEYIGSINNAEALVAGITVPTGGAKLIKWAGQSAEKNGIAYWIVTYNIEFRRQQTVGGATHEGFKRVVLDQGLYEASDASRTIIKDGDGAPVTEPQRLNGSGKALAPDGTASWRTFHTLVHKDWSSLNLNI